MTVESEELCLEFTASAILKWSEDRAELWYKGMLEGNSYQKRQHVYEVHREVCARKGRPPNGMTHPLQSSLQETAQLSRAAVTDA